MSRPPHKPSFIGTRENQISQLARRYASTYKIASDNSNGTSVRIAFTPTNPDFPYDLEQLKLQINIPKEYPKSPVSIIVMNQDIPKGFAVNLERGFDEYVSNVKTTLVRQLGWLDKNMETLLQKPAAATVKFVSHTINANNNNLETKNQIAPPLPDYLIKSATTAVDASPSTSSAPLNNNNNNNKVQQKKDHTEKVSVTKSSQPSKSVPTFTATDEELAAAFGRRSREINHISSRLRDSLKLSKTDRTILFVSIILNDPGFKHLNFFDDNILKLKYIVPLQYPIVQCYIEIENKNIGNDIQNHISNEFDYHVKLCPEYTLFEHLNWLHRHMENILNKPPPINIEPVTPLLKQIRSPSSDAIDLTSTPIKIKQDISIFKDDKVKNNVIIVNDPSFMPPTTINNNNTQDASPSGSNHNKHNKESTGPEMKDQNAVTSLSPSSSSSSSISSSDENNALNVSEQPTVRRGTEIRLMKPQLENISFFRCISLYILVKCNRCKSTIDIENLLPIDSNTKDQNSDKGKNTATTKNERITSCSTCNSIIGAKFYSELIHDHASSMGLLQLSGCKAFDVLSSTFMGSCLSCLEDLNHTIRAAPNERPISIACFQCHTKITVALNEYRFINIGEDGQSFKIDTSTVVLKKKKKKDELFTVGQPLPNEGTCSHYSRSKRWFRFPCCGKLYPCDVCHDSKEDHSSERALRHICGMCSKEQSAIGNKPCSLCGYEFDKSHHKGTFWNGGEGVRNQALMDRNETRKHRGLHKTTSKKQERVGLAAKTKREKEQNQQNQ
ncbi:unnamed protein product [Cunninghamella blakesleeana]